MDRKGSKKGSPRSPESLRAQRSSRKTSKSPVRPRTGKRLDSASSSKRARKPKGQDDKESGEKESKNGIENGRTEGDSSPLPVSEGELSSPGLFDDIVSIGSDFAVDIGLTLVDNTTQPQSQELNTEGLDERAKIILQLFNLFGGNATSHSKITVQEVRKGVRKNKKVVSFTKEHPFLQPILVPRLFYNSLKSVGKPQDGSLSFQEFQSFISMLEKWKLVDTQTLQLVELMDNPKDIKVTDLPYAFYKKEKAREFLILCEKENDPIAALLRPVTCKKALKAFLQEHERLEESDSLMEEHDFLALATFVVEEWELAREERRSEEEQVIGRGETFAELAVDAANRGEMHKAAELASQCVRIAPRNKVYRLAHAEYLMSLRRYEEALNEAELAMEYSSHFWKPACDRVRSLNALLSAKRMAELAAQEL